MINPNREESASDMILRIIRSKKINLISSSNISVEKAGTILAIIKNFLQKLLVSVNKQFLQMCAAKIQEVILTMKLMEIISWGKIFSKNNINKTSNKYIDKEIK